MENNGKKDKPEFGKERLKFAIAQLSFSILALFWIDNYIDTHAISNMWASAILEVGFMMLGWSSIFMFFYITVEGYSLVSPNAKIQKAALSFYKYSFSFSFLLLFVVVLTVGYAKFIIVLSSYGAHFYICFGLLLLATAIVLFAPGIVFMLIVGIKISTVVKFSLNPVIATILYMVILGILFVIPAMTITPYFLSGTISVNMADMVDKEVKMVHIEVEVTGDVSTIDESISTIRTNMPPAMEVTLITRDFNSSPPSKMDSICFPNFTACNESKYLSGCGEGKGKFNLYITVENLDSGYYQLGFERTGYLKYTKGFYILQ